MLIHFGYLLSLYIHFCKHREVYVVLILGKFEYFFIRGWLLATKLIAGKSQDVEATAVVVLLERGQFTVVIVGVATLTGYVYNKRDLCGKQIRIFIRTL